MANYDKLYQEELQKLKNRVRYYQKKGYDVNLDTLLAPTISMARKEYQVKYIKDLKGQRIIDKGVVPKNQNITQMSYYKNAPQADVTPDTVAPEVYSRIQQIFSLIEDFPLVLTIQFDEGKMGVNKYGDRDTVSVEFIGQALWDIWNNTVNKAIAEEKTTELEHYLEEVEPRLREILEPYFTDIPYHWESEMIKDYIEMLTLLNWGEALSQEEMDNISRIYDMTDIDIHEYGDEYY